MNRIDRLLVALAAAGLWVLVLTQFSAPGTARSQELRPDQVRAEVKAVLNRCTIAGHVSDRDFSNLNATLQC